VLSARHDTPHVHKSTNTQAPAGANATCTEHGHAERDQA
jgi:hypothetical protein